jgi:hypothetical protein
LALAWWTGRLEVLMGEDKKGNSWLAAFKRVRKTMPPPTKVKQGKKGKGVPYRRERDRPDAGK